VDEAVTAMLAELAALGIKMKEDRSEVYFSPAPPPELLARLKPHKEQVANAIWGREGRIRQAAALERLAADRLSWIEENKRLGKYRGP